MNVTFKGKSPTLGGGVIFLNPAPLTLRAS